MDMTTKALLSSEVFRIFAASELQKDSQKQDQEYQLLIQASQQLDQLELQIKNTPELLEKFKTIKASILEDPDYANQVDPKLLDTLFMLDI